MRTKIFFLVGAAAMLTAGGCARPQSSMARAPHIDLPATTAAAPAREAKSGATYDTQQGFENALPPPDAVGGGPTPGVDSDVGEPKWRNNPGSYDDGKRPKDGARRIQPNTSNKDMNDNEHILPPDSQ